jgi:type IV pilus assembly protein PilA
MTNQRHRGKTARVARGHPSSPIPHPSLRRKAQLGFGLGLRGNFVETLGIPAAIIAILAAVAIPAYSDFRAKARVTEELNAVAAPARTAVEKAFIARGPADMSRRSITGWMRPGFRPYLQSAGIAKNGTITLRFTDDVAPQAQNQIQIVPVSGGKPLDLSQAANAGLGFEWQCGGPAGRSTLPEKLRPENCRPGSHAK